MLEYIGVCMFVCVLSVLSCAFVGECVYRCTSVRKCLCVNVNVCVSV